MPRISEFYGIVISLYWAEHPPPHFHARSGAHRAAVDIATLEVIAGRLPSRAMRLVHEWGELHRAELAATWEALAHEPLGTIEPVAMNDRIPVVTAVELLHDFVLGVTFDDGTVGQVDLMPHLWGPVFAPLREDPALFAQVSVDDEEGTIVWPNGADVAPEMLYREAAAARTS